MGGLGFSHSPKFDIITIKKRVSIKIPGDYYFPLFVPTLSAEKHRLAIQTIGQTGFQSRFATCITPSGRESTHDPEVKWKREPYALSSP